MIGAQSFITVHELILGSDASGYRQGVAIRVSSGRCQFGIDKAAHEESAWHYNKQQGIPVRIIKVLLVAGMALFVTLAAFGNITMPDVGMGAITTAVGMETTFKHPMAMWRAISNPWAVKVILGTIVIIEVICAFLLWRGALRMWNARSDVAIFHAAKNSALLGLGLVACLYFVGWLVICNEYFEMWQSQKLNVLPEAFWNFAEAMLIMIWVNTRDE
jgi:predicted small integral membrane protein